MKVSESELIAPKSRFAMPPARAAAWDLPGEKTPFAGARASLPKPRSASRLSLVQAGSVSASVSNSLNQASDMRIYEDSHSLIGSERCRVLRFQPSPPPTQMEVVMKSVSAMSIALLLIATPPCIAQQVVGSTQLGVAYAELRDVTSGWSTKRQVLGKKVFNDRGETIGKIDDIIVAPDKAVSYAIIGAGGFLGLGRHDVAIPVNQLKEDSGKFILAA